MAVSSHFITGMGNKNAISPCEDYAMDSQRTAPVPDCTAHQYAVLSDGCSSGRYTDIGARLICAIAMQRLEHLWHPTQDAKYLDAFHEILNSYGVNNNFSNRFLKLGALQAQDFLATLGYIIYHPETSITKKILTAHLIGDGVVYLSFKDSDKDPIYIELQSQDNAPYYPVYSTNLYDSMPEGRYFTVNLINQTGEEIETFQGKTGYKMTFDSEALSKIDYVAVLSDGITSSDTHATSIIPELFKANARHSNVPRRALNRMDQKNTYNFYDDVSFAVWMNDE